MRIGGETKRWTDFAGDELEFQYNPAHRTPALSVMMQHVLGLMRKV